MRKRLFQWHLMLGTAAGLLIIIWGSSGAAMMLEPLLLRPIEKTLPRFSPPAFSLRAFRISPASLPVAHVASVRLQSYGTQYWYEVTSEDGTVSAYDAGTGRLREPLLPAAVILSDLRSRLKGSRWSPGGTDLISEHTDVYGGGPLPVYQVSTTGPYDLIFFINARSGKYEQLSTRYSRIFRWLGIGIHTWNFRMIVQHLGDLRNLLFVACVAAPLITMGLVSYTLLILRFRSTGKLW